VQLPAADLFPEQHGQRVRLLARRAARHPYAQGIPVGLLDQRTDDLLAQRLPGVRVAEKRRDGDQEVVEERLHLSGVLPQQGQVPLEPDAVVELHAPRQATEDRGALVAAEVVPGPRPEHLENAPQRDLVVLVDLGLREHPTDLGIHFLLLPCKLREPLRELSHGQHDVGDVGGDDCTRHALVRRFARILYQHDAARFLDGLRADGAVGAAAREDHRESVAVAPRERAEEHVDRGPLPARLLESGSADGGIADLQLAIRGDDVYGVLLQLELLIVPDFDDVHRGVAREDRCELAFVMRGEVQHHDVGESEVVRQDVEEDPERFDAARGSSDADHRHPRRRHFSCFLLFPGSRLALHPLILDFGMRTAGPRNVRF
jgi:hypothetical protein